MEIKTGRLYIRSLQETDWADMKEIFVDFNNSEYAVYDMPLPTDDSEVKRLVKKFADSNLFFAIRLINDKDIIGYMCFHVDGDKYDIGYCFHSRYHSNGYAYESANALISYFAQAHRVTCFTAGTAIENIPSCKLLNKLGFVRVSTEIVSFDGAFSFEGGNFVLDVNRAMREKTEG